MKKQFFYPFIFFWLLVFASCQKTVVVAPPEYNAVPVEPILREPSLISIPVSIPYETVKQSVKKSLGDVLYDDDSFENNDNDDIKIKVTQTGDLRLIGHKEYIKVGLPVKVFFAGRYIACDFCPEISKSTTFEMEAEFISRISLETNWRLNTTTESNGFVIKKDPYMTLGPLNINIRLVVEKVLKKQLADLTKLLDNTLRENVNLKAYAETAWKELQNPILADSTYNAWLYFTPQEFWMTPLVADREKITIKGALLTHVNTQLGAKPINKITKLPGLTLKESIPQAFRLEMPVDIDYAEATRQARLAFKDSVFAVTSKKSVRIDDIEVYGRGGEVFIKTRMSGAVRATVYLKGKPAFNPEKAEIYFENFDFELNTKQAMLKAASWLLKSTLRKKMDAAFRYNIAEDLNGASAAIKTYLNGYTYQDILEMKGSLGKLVLKGISADEYAIKAVFYAEGKASVKIINLSF
ncbi:MAG: DUF4403 family protein [Flavobacteriales bacterium]|nr:DUF4403 family protein [Flavobacteriales bacterium]